MGSLYAIAYKDGKTKWYKMLSKNKAPVANVKWKNNN